MTEPNQRPARPRLRLFASLDAVTGTWRTWRRRGARGWTDTPRTWPRTGALRGGHVYQLAPAPAPRRRGSTRQRQAPPTPVLIPTPTASDGSGGPGTSPPPQGRHEPAHLRHHPAGPGRHPVTTPPETPGQAALFDTSAPDETPGALVYLAADAAAYSALLAGDGYDWLGRLLPPPAALPCPRCHRPMLLPAVPLLWECPACDTREERRNST